MCGAWARELVLYTAVCSDFVAVSLGRVWAVGYGRVTDYLRSLLSFGSSHSDVYVACLVAGALLFSKPEGLSVFSSFEGELLYHLFFLVQRRTEKQRTFFSPRGRIVVLSAITLRRTTKWF